MNTNQYNFSDDDWSDSDDDFDWISSHIHSYENKFLCEVEESYIRDEFNLYGLKPYFDYYEDALQIILSEKLIEDYDRKIQNNIYLECKLLYGMIHARYIVTNHGINKMIKKYKDCEFGFCPRSLCEEQAVLPVGMNSIPYLGKVKLYCPCCKEIYNIPDGFPGSEMDGAFFGPTFPHLLLLGSKNIPEFVPYEPTIFGFGITTEKAEHGDFVYSRKNFFEDENKVKEVDVDSDEN